MKTQHQFKFNVFLNRKWIDSVFYIFPLEGDRKEMENEVHKSLVDHDGYDTRITVQRVG